MTFVRDQGKVKWPSWIFHNPDCDLQLLFTHFKFPDLGVDHCRVLRTLGYQSLTMNKELIFIEAKCTLSTRAVILIDHCEMMFFHFIKVTKHLKKQI